MNRIGTASIEMAGKTRKRRVIFTPLVCSVLASFGIFGGISSLFVGIIFVTIHSFAAGDKVFDQIGTGLLIGAIPMILIGSIFLDMIEGKK